LQATIMEKHTLALRLGLAVFLAPALCCAQGYTITTVAGGVTPYYLAGTGDGSPATEAGLGSPAYDVAVDSPGNPAGAGNLYIVAGSLIRKVTPSGIISTVAGGGEIVGDYVPATQAALAATAIAVDSMGNLYIADTAFGTSRIRMVNGAGTIVTVAGGQPCCLLGDGGPATAAYISIPLGLAVDRSGNIYIAQSDNSNNYLIRRVSAASGTIATAAGGGTSTGDGGLAISASLARPSGVAVDTNGNFYIAESAANRIRKVSSDGVITTVAAIHSPWHVTVDSTGNLYVTQPSDATAQLLSPSGALTVIAGDGTHGFAGDGGPATGAEMDRPSGVVLGSQGAIYLSDATAGIARVRLLTPAPSLTITSTHTGYFLEGQTNATYTLTVGNAAGAPSTSSTVAVTVTETLPTGLSLESMTAGTGSGWSCTDNTCTNAGVLPGGSSFQPITVTVSVAANAPSSVTNTASASGGGSATAYASDKTVIESVCDVNLHGTTTVADVQAMINEARGTASPANDLNADGVVNVVDVQLVINSALGLGCSAT
jgi:uncharacterized repeat protein (TIGR01451 family)